MAKAKEAKRRTVGFSVDDETMAVIWSHQDDQPRLESQSAALRDIIRIFKEERQAKSARVPAKGAARG